MDAQLKQKLISNKDDILRAFNRFRTIRPYLAVYSKEGNGVFITFGFSSVFQEQMYLKKSILQLICVFDCGGDFETQFSTLTG
jgi:hypothetical protein